MSAENEDRTKSIVIEMPIKQATSFSNALDPYINELETARSHLNELNLGDHPSIKEIEDEIEELQMTKRTLNKALTKQKDQRNNRGKGQNKDQNRKQEDKAQKEDENKEKTSQEKSQNKKQNLDKSINKTVDTKDQIIELLVINRGQQISPGKITKIVNDDPMQIMQTLSELTTEGYITESEKRNTYVGTEKLFEEFE